LSLELTGIAKTFAARDKQPAVEVLRDISLSIEPGRFIAVVGPSGCGKTTLLRIIAGLEPVSRGRVLLGGDEVQGSPGRVGLVFQDYALFPWRTTVDNIATGLQMKGTGRLQRRQEAQRYVAAFGLEGFEQSYPHQLSGGMQQRVAIARAMIMEPEVILMDEPFGSLDSQTRNALQEFLLRVWQQRQDTIVFVTHNVDEAVFLADEIIILSARPARVVQRVNVEASRPRDRTSAQCNAIRRRVLGMLQEQRGDTAMTT